MFTYRCPGCGKHHVVDGPFEGDFQSPCLRCGASISVTAELVHQTAAAAAPPSAITKKPAAKVAAGMAGEASGAKDEVELRGTPDDRTGITRKRRPPAADEEDEEKDRPPKKKSVRPPSKPAAEVAEEDEEEPENKPAPPPKWPPAPVEKKSKPRWQLIAAVAAAVLLVGGAGAYFVFGGKKAPKPVAKKTDTKPKTTTKAPPPKEEKKPEPPVPKGPPKPDVVLSAPHLAAELAASPVAHRRYAGQILEVTGLFDKIEKKEGLTPPARPHALFAAEGTVISCDLGGSPTEMPRWNRLPPGKPVTVRGVYEKDGCLRDCWLMPTTPPADSVYLGKEIEVTGTALAMPNTADPDAYPTLPLEGETNSPLTLHCLFAKSDRDEVKKIQPGTLVTVAGVCNGRTGDGGERAAVRIDNCRFVYAPGPPAGTPRLEAVRILRAYEEDLRTFYLPPWGEEERVVERMTVQALARELSADPRAFEAKYRRRVLTLTGKPAQELKGQVLILESGDTSQALRVRCRFGLRAFRDLDRRPEYRVRGLCAGVEGKDIVALDNCELDEPVRKGPAVTEDFLPHTPGKALTYDVAVFGAPAAKKKGDVVQRWVHLQGVRGLTETTATYVGVLPGASLFDEGEPEKWITHTKTRKVPPAPGPVYYRRLSGGFVEIGEPVPGAGGKPEVAWLPVLKIGARAGDHWGWNSPAGEREFVLEKFDDYHGRPAVVVRETITAVTDLNHPVEVLHVYAQGIGEVEQRQWKRINAKENRLLLERRFVENPRAGLERKPAPAGGAPADAKKPQEGKGDSPARK